MDRLRGVEALSVVFKRFSDGCEVVQCISDFYKDMSELEHYYAARVLKLLESANYTFHSNILMQWLGTDPYHESGTVKQCWNEMGDELNKLATLHAEKAESFSDIVRKPLIDMLPKLEEDRKKLKQQKNEMEAKMKAAKKKYENARATYYKAGNMYEQLKHKKPSYDRKVLELERDFLMQEDMYTQSHRELVHIQESMNSEVNEVLKRIQEHELERVNKIARSLKEFAKTLSNTAPAYLECMQRIVFSIDKVDGSTDIECFVMEHERLLEEPVIPTLELHSCSSRSNRKAKTEKSSDDFKNEDADDKLQKSLTDSKPAVAPKPSSTTSSSATGSSTSTVTGFLKPTPPQKKSFFKFKPTQSVKPVIATKETTGPEPTSATKTESPSTNDTIVPTTTEVIATYVKTTPTSTEATPTSSEVPPTGTKATQNKSPSRERSVTTATNKPSRAVKPHTLSSPPPPPPPQNTNNGSFSESQDSLFAQLTRKTRQSDYYGLLGVLPTADQEELSRARREITVKLHPDHFTNDPIKQEKAQERLIIINQAYSDVLSNKTNRELYDQLVRYREKYHRILEQTGPSLDTAKMKLSSLRSSMKKARFPMALLEELQLAIRLIEDKQLQLGATLN
ncbi:PREDICTED: uncharacterized protein LOC109582354 isoform X1 [Amphimedon queenslandica]|uniref:J domain-containing protein n=1 Tax=Amphimedon queenslandica TaxID=400682 RepID=A0A1X7USG4_AMPQE|nr:PREDICTED: uncharacterized protein LOC109582354 isoform X1 [Amphimedon queenslandica]|eukprot:XP_019852579.1 PREDICTED: uncharacterized protein LOC109582354 isoform X1 [Amphimedon queenslandica]